MIQPNDVLGKLQALLPNIKFIKGNSFVWSYTNQTVTYTELHNNESIWALIHESAHAKLQHRQYTSDHALLKMEVDAWTEAKQIAKAIGITIDNEHAEDCLDTYRDWLHIRATCPNCQVVGLQQNDQTYKCINCQCAWKVPGSPLHKTIKKKVGLVVTANASLI